ncbi:MAG TPA: cobalt-precorrin 5A hydrolase [Methanoregulaceae archaeon]|nr:cobalt-precorrin 5A hydrolase [Methanoregulaceae archaeon]
MSETVVIAPARFEATAEQIAWKLNADLLGYEPDAFSIAFSQYRRIIAVMATGIVVRRIAPLLVDKWTDPAVVVVSPDLAFAVPLIGGHHGANELARELSLLGIRPVITTATETKGLRSVEGIAADHDMQVINRSSTRQVNAGILDGTTRVFRVRGPSVVLADRGVSFLSKSGLYSVGLGCRLGITREEAGRSIAEALSAAGIRSDEVMIFATTEKKISETGLISAVESLGGNLIFLDDDTIKAQETESPSEASRIGLPAVAEPAALAVSCRKELVMKKRVFGKMTVAIAR